MGFFHNIRNALIRFMYGRNGMDHLNQALIRSYLLLWLLSMLLSVLKLEKVAEFPVDGTQHAVIVLRKVKPTPPQYPRRFAKIKQSPL